MTRTQYVLIILCLVGIGYIIFYQNVMLPRKLKRCNDMAIVFEKGRHELNDDLTVTHEDIASYMKNMVNCVADLRH